MGEEQRGERQDELPSPNVAAVTVPRPGSTRSASTRTSTSRSANGITTLQRCSAQMTRVGSPVVRMPIASTAKKAGMVANASPGALLAKVCPPCVETSPVPRSPSSYLVRSTNGVPWVTARTSA
jgi:hypothetical protein